MATQPNTSSNLGDSQSTRGRASGQVAARPRVAASPIASSAAKTAGGARARSATTAGFIAARAAAYTQKFAAEERAALAAEFKREVDADWLAATRIVREVATSPDFGLSTTLSTNGSTFAAPSALVATVQQDGMGASLLEKRIAAGMVQRGTVHALQGVEAAGTNSVPLRAALAYSCAPTSTLRSTGMHSISSPLRLDAARTAVSAPGTRESSAAGGSASVAASSPLEALETTLRRTGVRSSKQREQIQTMRLRKKLLEQQEAVRARASVHASATEEAGSLGEWDRLQLRKTVATALRAPTPTTPCSREAFEAALQQAIDCALV
ncbi:MAG: hypothetical protein EOO41_05200, partial [Methanobacteriota archaeon]